MGNFESFTSTVNDDLLEINLVHFYKEEKKIESFGLQL